MTAKKFLLQEKDIPTAWYNIVADMKREPMTNLGPQTGRRMEEEDWGQLV